MKNRFIKIVGGATLGLALVTATHAQSAKGSASEIPAYYDHELFTIQFVEFSPAAEQSLLKHNKSLNFIKF